MAFVLFVLCIEGKHQDILFKLNVINLFKSRIFLLIFQSAFSFSLCFLFLLLNIFPIISMQLNSLATPVFGNKNRNKLM